MSLFETISILIVLAAIFSYLNHRFLRLPTTIGLLSMALVVSLLLLWFGRGSSQVYDFAQSLLASIDFNRTLIHGMLGFLLFAGALSVNLDDLRQQMAIIALLSTGGVLLSTLIVGMASWILLDRVLELPVSLPYCFLFGALISPTDPIAVLAILKRLGVPKTLETKIAGESLFNDGIGVVLFLAIAGMIGFGGADDHFATAAGGATFQIEEIARLFVVEAGGGGLLGFLLGWVAYRRSSDREPRSPLCHVGNNSAAPLHLLGSDRRDPQRRALPSDRFGGAGSDLHPESVRRLAFDDSGGSPGAIRRRRELPQPPATPAVLYSPRREALDLGRSPWRYLGGSGPFHSAPSRRLSGARKRDSPVDHLLGAAMIDAG
jgi:CPA1 family monovalent cation:H+ antiporter